MYVVNDLPIDNTQLNLPGIGNGAGQTRINVDRGDGTAVINPDDIKTITVLKGGTAAALYGANAANGVILIQTKEVRFKKELELNTILLLHSKRLRSYQIGSTNMGLETLIKNQLLRQRQ